MLESLKFKIVDQYLEVKQAWQRAKRGYSDSDIWNYHDAFIEKTSAILKNLSKNHIGHPLIDENGDYYRGEDYSKDVDGDKASAKWSEILEHMAFLLDEMNEDTCSKKNPYEEQWWRYHEEFDRKYPKHGDELKTPEDIELEKRTGGVIYVGPERDPDFGEDYQAVAEKYLKYEIKLDEYRDKCKDEFMEMFKKYFWSLWD